MVSWDTRMLSSSGYRVFSQPEICSGDQSRIITRNDVPQLQVDGKKAALGPQGGLPGFAVRLTGSGGSNPSAPQSQVTLPLAEYGGVGRRSPIVVCTTATSRLVFEWCSCRES